MPTDRTPLLVLLVALLAAAGCRVERFDRAGCQCLKELPGPRNFADELRLRRCVASKSEDGPADLSELQCRSWLTSPWESEPPRDDVAGRVVPDGAGHCPGGTSKPPRHPPESPGVLWYEDLPARWDAMKVYIEDDGRPEPAEVIAGCAPSAIDWNRADIRHPLVAGLVDFARRTLSEYGRQQAEAIGLPLHIIVSSDGHLEMATVGRRWWSVPAAAPPNLPKALADEVPRVDIAAILAEVRWLKTLNPNVFARVAAHDDVPWRDMWAVLWALDQELVADRTARYHTLGSILEPVSSERAPDPQSCLPGSWPAADNRIVVTEPFEFQMKRGCVR